MTKSNATKTQIEELEKLFGTKELSSELKISKVTSLFRETKADVRTAKLVEDYTNSAIKYIDDLSIEEYQKEEFRVFSIELMNRKL